jgi:hypothetical protein
VWDKTLPQPTNTKQPKIDYIEKEKGGGAHTCVSVKKQRTQFNDSIAPYSLTQDCRGYQRKESLPS